MAILSTASRVLTDMGKALGAESPGYEGGVRMLHEYGNKTVFEVIAELLRKVAPVAGSEHTLTPDTIQGFVQTMGTRERAELVLSALPEPDPKMLQRLLKEVSRFPSEIRRILDGFTVHLPPPPGGRDRIFKTPAEERRAREEVSRLMTDRGLKFAAAKRKYAREKGISMSSVQRLFRDENGLEDMLQED
jgi:hypothetical protein